MTTPQTRPQDYQRNQNEVEKEENYLNLWSYVRRRYPDLDIEGKNFMDLIHLKNNLEGPQHLRRSDGEIAMVRKH